MKPPVDGFWAKLRRAEDGEIIGWHPLVHHCADVAAVLEALLRLDVIGKRLARLGERECLSEADIARLCYLAALHDAGKVNHGFQAKKEVGGQFSWAGHVQELIGLLFNRMAPSDLGRSVERALELDTLLPWFAGDVDLLGAYLGAAIAHHGKPANPEGARICQRTIWEPRFGVDPMQGLEELVCAARSWFPNAFRDDSEALPSTQPFIHAFTGLLMLADWIGSDCSESAFPYSVEAMNAGERMAFARERAGSILLKLGIDAGPARCALQPIAVSFDTLKSAPEQRARPAQTAVERLSPAQSGSTVVLEAETGSGKTEAALVHFLKLFRAGHVDGMYFALPTRTAATQIQERVTAALERVFPTENERPAVVLAVPGYLRVDDAVGHRGSGFEVAWSPALSAPEALWNDDDLERYRYRAWAAENSKRYLAGTVVVGTIDQVLLSALRVNHAHLRASSLFRHLLVVDEVHASDGYMNVILNEVLDRHRAAGGHAFLMSATLGGSTRAALLGGRGSPAEALAEAVSAPYPLLSVRDNDAENLFRCAIEHSGPSREISTALVNEMTVPRAVAHRALAAARKGARVLVLRNTVNACLKTQRHLEAAASREERRLLFGIGSVACPHHARYAREDRISLDQAIEARFGKNRRESGGAVAVATQTVQQSLDLDADWLITDLCPMDVLLQRVGRLHRHARSNRPRGYESPSVVVLVPDTEDLGRFIREDGTVAGARGSGMGTVYEDLRILQATWDLLSDVRVLRIPSAARALVEPTVHPEALNRLVSERGEKWTAHARKLTGRLGADRAIAKLNIFRLDDEYLSLSFNRPDDGSIKTRLGVGDRLVDLVEDRMSPFGNKIRFLTLQHWLVRDADTDEQARRVEAIDGGLRFEFGSRSYRYDRLGLREDSDVGDDEVKDI